MKRSNTKPVAVVNRTPEIIAADLAAAKRAESEANKARVALEEELIQHLGFDRIEGSQTYTLGEFKVVVTGKLNRKPVDIDALVLACDELPTELRPIKVKTELDSTAARKLAEAQPELYAKIARQIVTEPAKTAVAISRVL